MQNPQVHEICREDLKQFNEIPNILLQFNQHIDEVLKKLDQVFRMQKKKFKEYYGELEATKNLTKLISSYFEERNYQQIKNNLSSIKEAYDYLKNKDEENIRNEISCQLNKVKKFIEAIDLDQGQQQLNVLKQTINVLNQKKWSKALEMLEVHTKKAEQFLSYTKFYQSIALIELNQPGKGIMIREQAKKLSENLFSELLQYANKVLQDNPKNIFMLITKSYAL